MAKYDLPVEPRTQTGRNVKKLRLQGKTPANIFGKGVKSVDVQVDTKQFKKLTQQVGESTLVYLKLASEKEERPVLVSSAPVHPITGDLLHVSFHQVNLKEKVTAHVPVELIGVAPAEKDKQGIMVQQMDELEIEALPTDMPENIQVDVSSLEKVNDSIFVRDIKINSDKLSVKDDPENIIVKIEPLAKEEVVETVAAPVAATETSAEPVSETPAAPAAPVPAEEKPAK